MYINVSFIFLHAFLYLTFFTLKKQYISDAQKEWEVEKQKESYLPQSLHPEVTAMNERVGLWLSRTVTV